MNASFSFSAGLLVRPQVRKFLEREQFTGEIRFIESKGLLESEFTIKGPVKDVDRVFKTLQNYAEQIA